MFDYPDILEIQFHNICNANCSVCPYEQYAAENGKRKMMPSLREKVLADISLNQSKIKRIIPYFNNEPFLDKEFTALLEWFDQNTPGIDIEVSTNLSAFKEDVFEKILTKKLIDDLRISFFGGTRETYNHTMPGLNFDASLSKLRAFLDLRQKLVPDSDYDIIMVLHPDVGVEKEVRALRAAIPDHHLKIRLFGYLDRAGSNSFKNVKILDEDQSVRLDGCSLKRNEERLCISVDGRIPLCSQDWFNRENLGNLNHQTIHEIWNSQYKESVDQIISGDSSCPSGYICRDCKLVRYKNGDESVLNFTGDKYMTDQDKKKIQITDI